MNNSIVHAFVDPDVFWRPSLFSPNKTTITIPQGIRVVIDGRLHTTEQDVILKLSDLGASTTYAGKDVYIYACKPEVGSILIPVLSLNSTVPTGYTEENSRKIAGFHCLCKNSGDIDGHTLTEYKAGEILPLSVWDLKHRPVSEPEGMVWVEGINRWVDIYFPSWNGSKMVSSYAGTILDGTSDPSFNGEKFSEYAPLSKKSLCSREEFLYFSKGSNELTNIAGSADPTTTGGHVDTSGRRMISNYGIEDCCGALWQWTRDTYEDYPNSKWNATYFYLDDYSWQEKSIYNPKYDLQKMGECAGLLRRARVGGYWGDGIKAGTRATACSYFSAHGYGTITTRLVSEPKVQV